MEWKSWGERYKKMEPTLEKKRFHLAPEQFSKERLVTLKQKLEQFKKGYPEIIGFSIFGSTSKGYSSPESDLDVFIYFEEDKLGDFLPPFEEFKEEIKTSLGVEKVDSVSFYLNKSKLDENIERVRGSLAARSMGLEEILEIHNPLIGLFMGISMGKQIWEYRLYILTQLKKLGDEGEAIWRALVDMVATFEHPRGRDAEISAIAADKFKHLYPWTIDEAMRYFVEHKPFSKSS